MARNIVLCSDGTGNRDVKARGSNVFKVYEAVDIQGYKRDPGIPIQVAYYDDGVGSQSLLPLKLLGGAFGFGIARNVCRLYTELAHVYEPGDRIFLFGFSRGAYTVRTLSGMVQYCGIVDRRRVQDEAALDRQVTECWREFRSTFARFVSDAQRRGEKPRPRDGESSHRRVLDAERRRRLCAVEHEEAAPEGRVNIEFIGVWDTVCAVGMPFDELRDFLNYFVYPVRFSDLTPGDQVRFARHALAIDDERRTFWPELWNERGARPGQVEQVWFAGAHSNVGGGYPRQGMALAALDWMMAHAEAAGLRFIPEAREFVRRQQDVHDKLYDSGSWIAGSGEVTRASGMPCGTGCAANLLSSRQGFNWEQISHCRPAGELAATFRARRLPAPTAIPCVGPPLRVPRDLRKHAEFGRIRQLGQAASCSAKQVIGGWVDSLRDPGVHAEDPRVGRWFARRTIPFFN